MAIQMAKTLAFTAVGGLVAGLVGCGGEQKTAETPAGGASATTDTTAAATAETAGAKNCCKGQNECKGKGNCKVEGKQDCKGKNECKGQGGCKGADCAAGDASPTPAPGANPS